MKYKISVEKSFSSAHYLRNYKGKCENLHGHNWKVSVTFFGDKLDDVGMLIDFANVKIHLHKIIKILDHNLLNKINPFDKINPTSENIAAFIFERFKCLETKNVKIYEVKIWESESSSATIMA
ncbi:MAG: 6-carboxytetrahydropterin synthase QueD [Endomicrobium sp.]|jgi:6-pyruvoyltetrahydropterin/6-carboxytetrahydropterin synthase|nr:6-carboxytetrahydropterin synthase QueD [Endomicrobium sp.]